MFFLSMEPFFCPFCFPRYSMIICLKILVNVVGFVLLWGVNCQSLYEREIWARVDHGYHSGFLVFPVY